MARKTAGELVNKASADTTKYQSSEVGHALTDDVLDELRKCAYAHENKINEPEFCVVMLIGGDPMLQNIMRRKFYAWPYLPKPRPNQAVFLYTKATQSFKRLWVLPNAWTMAALSSMPYVEKSWASMKRWSTSFYNKTFHPDIRKEHEIDMLSEAEYLEANREKLVQAGCQEVDLLPSEPFDFCKVTAQKVVDTDDVLANK